MCSLKVLDSNGLEVKEKESKINSFNFSLDATGKYILNIFFGLNEIEQIKGIIGVFGDASCTIVRTHELSYLLIQG